MKLLQYSASLAILVAACEAIPAPKLDTRVPHEKRSSSGPTAWRRSAPVDVDAIIPIRIGLTQNELHNGYSYLMDVSHPSSPNFGKHWTQEQVHSTFSPSDETVEAVRAWLVDSGIDYDQIVHSDNKGWLALDIPAYEAERLFSTKYYEHEHSTFDGVRLGCDSYHIPEHIADHVDYVTPGVKLSAPLKKRTVNRRGPTKRDRLERRSFDGPGRLEVENNVMTDHNVSHLPPDVQDCGANITPPCLKALYDIPEPRATPDNVNSMGLFESGDTYSQEDIDLFFAAYAPYVPQGTHPIPAFIDGAMAPVPQGSPYNTGESDIDIDMAFSLIYPQTVTLYQTDDRPQSILESSGGLEGFLNTFLDALDGSYCTYSAYGITGDSPGIDAKYPDPLPGGYEGSLQCGVYTPTRVISGSYGEAEGDLPINYQKRQCNEFMKLGLQGHTILFSSGDYGVAGFPGDISESGCSGPDQTVFTPDYPSNCPYITSVGATRLYAYQDVKDPESALQADLGPGALSLFASGGGFSNYFTTPGYQAAAVAEYFADHDPGLAYYVYDGTLPGAGGGVYNRAGRGFPDISANGAEYRAYNNGTLYHFYGTSLAAPLWGSVMTLINEERTYHGKGPVGFVNPVFYANPGIFHDIVNGSNPGCGTPGFKAVPGWDPITGLGTPHYNGLKDLYLSLP